MLLFTILTDTLTEADYFDWDRLLWLRQPCSDALVLYIKMQQVGVCVNESICEIMCLLQCPIFPGICISQHTHLNAFTNETYLYLQQKRHIHPNLSNQSEQQNRLCQTNLSQLHLFFVSLFYMHKLRFRNKCNKKGFHPDTFYDQTSRLSVSMLCI